MKKRNINFKQVVSFFLLVIFLNFIETDYIFADNKGTKIDKNAVWNKADPENGKNIYLTRCAFCHSESGDGQNWVGLFIIPHPRDFTNWNVMKDISRERMFNSILNGRPGTAMPTWKGMISDNDIRDVIVYIEKEFIKKGKKK